MGLLGWCVEERGLDGRLTAAPCLAAAATVVKRCMAGGPVGPGQARHTYLPPSTTTPGCAGGLGRAGLGRVMIRPGGPSSAPGAERAPPGGLRQWGFGSIRVPRAAIWAWNWAAGGGGDGSQSPRLTRPPTLARRTALHPRRWTSCATAPVRGGLALPRQHCAWAAGGHDEQGLPAWLVPGESPAERRQQPTPVVPVPFPPRPCPALACARTNGDVIRWPDAMGWDGGC